MVAYKIRYRVRFKKQQGWTDLYDREEVVVSYEDATTAIDEIKSSIDGPSHTFEFTLTGVEKITDIDFITEGLISK